MAKEKKEYHRNYYLKNKSRICENNKNYYENNKDKIKSYYDSIKEKRKAYMKNWRKNNKDKRYLYNKIHYQNTESYKQYQNRYQKDYIKRKEYALKMKAYNQAKYWVPMKGLCEKCKIAEAEHRHHPNYSNPRKVILLCRKCHLEEHNKKLILLPWQQN